MITNSKLTVYHFIDGVWKRYNYSKVWWHGGKGANLNKGYDNANDVEIRIPFDENKELDPNNFSTGDILVQGELTKNITVQEDLPEDKVYILNSIVINNYGNNKHIHLGGK